MLIKAVILGIIAYFVFESTASTSDIVIDNDSDGSPLSQTCLRCICKVMGCKKDEGCVGNVCGVFHITQGYWEAAHYRDSSADNIPEYEECSNNVWCATRTVQRYMTRHLPTCESKRPDRLRCENALAAHKLGHNRCERNLTVASRNKLLSCLQKLTWKWLEDDDKK